MTNRFDDLAATWDDDPTRADRAGQVADAIAARIPIQRNWSVVDLGSGTGLLGLAGSVGERPGCLNQRPPTRHLGHQELPVIGRGGALLRHRLGHQLGKALHDAR